MFGRKLTNTLGKVLPTGDKGWRVLSVVGTRDDPVSVIGEAIKKAGLIVRTPRGGWTEAKLIDALAEAAVSKPKAHGGIILFIDEMGKFLEAAVQNDSDVYIFQQLAEAASRSGGRFIVIGVLHQAFEEYAHRLSHETRDEWAKIQGRFVDLVVDTAGEEQIELISRAIESSGSLPKGFSQLAATVAEFARRKRADKADRLGSMLKACWPLHPVVACLLGPISRRRFGQNQRSIFGFLNSVEQHGFQDFLQQADDAALYRPERLWDYLRVNFEPSILASPDGHRWALAAEAIERCEAISDDSLHVGLLKTIAVIDLFKERSGLVANFDILKSCFPDVTPAKMKKTLLKLEKWSFTIFKKFLDAYAIYAGSDFDIDQAVQAVLDETYEVDFAALKSLAGLQPVLAKRHYHETGALRWFDVGIIPVSELDEFTLSFEPENGEIGQFLLAVPTQGESEDVAEKTCRKVARRSSQWDIVIGVSSRSWPIIPLAREMFALERISNEHPELAGDSIARREVSARLAALQDMLETDLHRAFNSARWFRKNLRPKRLRQAKLNSLASDLADKRFNASPKLHNELLNRQKPSGSASGAQNSLLQRMVMNVGEKRLGIEGFSAEGGLFASTLEATKLYRRQGKQWRFIAPVEGKDDPCRLAPLWNRASNHVMNNADRIVPVSELFDEWRKPPFGVRDGLMPILAVAFMLSYRDKLAVYRNGIFRARFDYIDAECLVNDAAAIQLRWMNLNKISRRLLSDMAEVVRTFDNLNELVYLEPIDVARGLVSVFDRLPRWTKRTMRLSGNAVHVREIFNRANDPNKFLVDDIPATLGEGMLLTTDNDLKRVVEGIRRGLEELTQAYPAMLHRLRDIMLAELQVPNTSPESLAELRERAENIKQLAGDFRLDAFVGRLARFDGSDDAFEGIASLAANKPPRDWVDLDLERAAVEIADMAQKSIRIETYVRVKGRSEKRHSMAVVIGMKGRPAPLLKEFDVTDSDRAEIDTLVECVKAALKDADADRKIVILAALAEISAHYMHELEKVTKGKAKERRAS